MTKTGLAHESPSPVALAMGEGARRADEGPFARHYMNAATPRVPQAHLVGSALFVADGSRLFDADTSLFENFNAAMSAGNSDEITELLRQVGFTGPPLIDDTPLAPPAIHALSLAIAQKCNLGCTYCYAQQGEFGGQPRNMALDSALQAVALLVSGAASGAKLNLAFLGGEPLVNRSVLRAATLHAVELAKRRGVTITFSITTNGTLVNESDAEFFEVHGFAVTVSLDGARAAHDAQRPFKNGRGSFDVVMKKLKPLLAIQKQMQVSARVTVTPQNLNLRETLDEFVSAGFHSVGFSPMLASPTGHGEMQADELEVMLDAMIACGHEFERRAREGQRYPFANMVNAMREIGRGTHRPYPCGAGAGYLGVSADGELSACHRFVGDESGAMGSLQDGVNREAQADWLETRHVHRQEPCNSCWARYLCGGGCHHEVIKRGRPACDYIRGWLHYCLEAYLRLSAPSIVTQAVSLE